MSESTRALTRTVRAPIPFSQLDAILTAQIILAWAGEGGYEPRLGWWRSDMVSEDGGIDIFKRLLPHSWEWAVLQAAREAARRTDAEARTKTHDPDTVVTLFSISAELDERLEERFQDLKRSGLKPNQALPGLEQAIKEPWQLEAFKEWLDGHGNAENSVMPVGRLIKGEPPVALDELARRLVASLTPLQDHYPLPHFRRTR